MNNRHLYILAIGLFVVGCGIFCYKTLVMRFPIRPQAQTDKWDVEVRISFVAHNKPVKVSLFIPRTTERHIIVDEGLISRGYGLTTKKTDGNRQAVWSIRKAKGLQILYYRAVVRQMGGKEAPPSQPPEFEVPYFEGPYMLAAESLVLEIQSSSADVETMVAELIKRINSPHESDNVSLLLGEKPSSQKKMEVAKEVLAKAGISARVAHGIQLQQLQRDAPLIHWLQVYEKDAWQSFDPVSGAKNISDDYLLWWRGPSPLVQVGKGSKLQTRISVSAGKEAALAGATLHSQNNNSFFIRFSPLSLPIDAQAVYRVLLVVPIGAFLLVILRNVIGFKTFGTFMPVLIALAFRETRLIWGLLMFIIIVGLGLSIRFYLEQLKLLLVPRLAAVLIVVLLLMTWLSIITHNLGLERGLSVALFPMVIITMTIERMSIVWEERGAAESLRQGIGSLVAAVFAYLVMNINYVEYLVFIFPELLLVLLSGVVLLGRYSGYRLLELRRFRALTTGDE
ncbi:MAG: inactive transglutaminase family protein [Thermodesulfobacteriota bacterium]|nr:inactive transglutaminase family protein [Thermodesulfobacteriota bacterium]